MNPNPASSFLQAVVFDWAGTVIDFGSQAPMGAFVELFRRHGVEIGIDEARVPGGPSATPIPMPCTPSSRR